MQQKFQLYINGEFCDGVKNNYLKSINPANNQAWAQYASASAQDVDIAVEKANDALYSSEWTNMLASDRGKLLYKLADILSKESDDIAHIETMDSGKLLKETLFQTRYVADYYRYFAGMADKIEGATLPIDKPDMHVFTRRVPIGVVAAVVPWNAQMFLTAVKLAPALAAGCTVIIKASEIAPCPILHFAKIIDKVGFPKGVVQVITGSADECSIPLTRHANIDRIAFTGGAETARHVIKNSAMNFAVTSLELGGKSPFIIFDDANLEDAVNGIIAGNFGSSGQSCVAGSRGFVQKSVKGVVIQKIKKRLENITIGCPLDAATDIGPLCTRAQVLKAEETIKKACDAGAKIIFGGKAHSLNNGFYFEPTLLDCPDDKGDSYLTEMFAPVMSLTSFEKDEDVIKMANDSLYGLGAGIFTQNLNRAHRVSDKIRAGICWINTYRAISPIAPFGGFNHSGYGREAGQDTIYDYTRTKTTWVNISEKPLDDIFAKKK